MARPEVNRLAEMEVFVAVVEAGGFSAAGRRLRMTPSAVSKSIARLEARLGAMLVRRSTRRLEVTPEGASFYEGAVRAIADIAAAEREAASGAAPRGRLRVNCNVPFGVNRLVPLLPGFMERHCEIVVDLVLTDHVVDLIEARADIAIRTGALADSRLIARKIGESGMAVVAAPAYLAARGMPTTPEDLAGHDLLGFCFSRVNEGWPFRETDGRVEHRPVPARALVSDGEAMRQMALAGAGIARLALWHVGADIAAGRLVPLLQAYDPGDREAIHAVYVGQATHLPARARAFLDYLVEKAGFR